MKREQTVMGKGIWGPELYTRGKGGLCVAALMGHNRVESSGRALWILGLNFLSEYLTVFDWDRKTVAFGVRKG